MSWAAVLGMGLCAFGIAVGGFLVGASLLGFRRCRTCGRYGQVVGSDGFVQCGECWRRQAHDFAGLETLTIPTIGNDFPRPFRQIADAPVAQRVVAEIDTPNAAKMKAPAEVAAFPRRGIGLLSPP
jgi:hypothetical protein